MLELRVYLKLLGTRPESGVCTAELTVQVVSLRYKTLQTTKTRAADGPPFVTMPPRGYDLSFSAELPPVLSADSFHCQLCRENDDRLQFRRSTTIHFLERAAVHATGVLRPHYILPAVKVGR